MTEQNAVVTPDELHRLSLFASVPYHEVADILTQCSIEEVSAGQIVIRGGEPSKRMYLIMQGNVSVRLTSPKAEPVAMLGRDEMFGEIAVIDGEPTTAFVIAESDCRLLRIERDLLSELFRRTAYVADNLLTVLAGRIRSSNLLIEELRQRLSA